MSYGIEISSTDGILDAKDIASARLVFSNLYTSVANGTSVFITGWNANKGAFTVVTTDGLDPPGLSFSGISDAGTTVTFDRSPSASSGASVYLADFVSQAQDFIVNYYHTDSSEILDNYGLAVFNQSNSVVVDTARPVMILSQTRTLTQIATVSYTVSAPSSGTITSTYVTGANDGRSMNGFKCYDFGTPQTDEQIFIPLALNEEVYCFNPRIQGTTSIYGYSGWQDKFVMIRSSANPDVKIMKNISDSGSVPSGYGLALYNASGDLTYNSTESVNRIVDHVLLEMDARDGATPHGNVVTIPSNTTHVSIPTSVKHITFCGAIISTPFRGFWAWGVRRTATDQISVIRGLFAVVGSGTSPRIFPTVGPLNYSLLCARIT